MAETSGSGSLMRLLRFFFAAFTIIMLLVMFSPLPNFLATGLVGVEPRVKKASLIAVLGGGGYRNGTLGRASSERLLHGLLLYRDGYGGRIIFSGGTILEPSKKLLHTFLGSKGKLAEGKDAVMAEASVMMEMALKLGVQDKAVTADIRSTNTYENLVNVKAYMDENSIKDCLIVTSAVHMNRAMLVAKRLGLDCRPAPVRDYTPFRSSPTDRFTLMREVVWEYLALALYRVYGYI